MGKILDLIVGNTYIFICVIGVLVAILVAIILSIVKSLNKHKIPIYEEINENIELENAKEENIIEKPTKKKAKKEQTEEKVEEVEAVIEEQTEIAEEDENDLENDEPVEVEEKVELEEEVTEEVVEESSEDEETEEVEPEFDDEALREELEKIDDKEIEERIDEEHKKNVDEEIKDNDNEELKEILSEMKDTNEVNPEEVVRNFEEEQEAQSIISYQELVNVVKNRENEFDDELESKPLTTVSDFIKKDKKSTTEPEANVLDMIEQLDKAKKQIKEEEIEELEANDEDLEELEELEVLEKVEVKSKKETKKEVEEETLSEIPEEGRFKKTDVISPVFGRIKEKNKIDYPKVEKFDRKKNKTVKNNDELDEELLSSIIPDFDNIELKQSKKHSATKAEIKAVSDMFDSITETIEEQEIKAKEIKAGNDDKKTEDDESIESLSAISKNEDFLKALRDFRNSL